MMERLFAVGEQREIFLMMTGCGFIWGVLQDGATMVRRRSASLGMAAEAVSAAALLAMLLGVLVATHEGVRLYGLLGVVIGALLYRSGVSRAADGLASLVKKTRSRHESGRKTL